MGKLEFLLACSRKIQHFLNTQTNNAKKITKSKIPQTSLHHHFQNKQIPPKTRLPPYQLSLQSTITLPQPTIPPNRPLLNQPFLSKNQQLLKSCG